VLADLRAEQLAVVAEEIGDLLRRAALDGQP
jgi:hypothetical protein